MQLGIGVPPTKFDTFIEDVQKIARVTYLVITKTDKTNEYRQLRARRETLEKARKAITDMAASGGTVDERLRVQAQLTDVEEKIQDLAVSLGDFNAENEFCTVKLTLTEITALPAFSLPQYALQAFIWATERFFYLSAGLLMFGLAFWLGVLAASGLVRLWARITHD